MLFNNFLLDTFVMEKLIVPMAKMKQIVLQQLPLRTDH